MPREGVEGVARWLEAGPGGLVVEPDPGPLGHDLAAEDVSERLRRADDVPLPSATTKWVVLARVGGDGGRVARGRTARAESDSIGGS